MPNLKIFTTNIDEKAKEQINLLLEQDAFKDCKVRIMPDVHAGAGCVIGFTANLGDKVIPNVVGVDIGCGMAWVKTNKTKKDIDFNKLDNIIRKYIPSGMNVRETQDERPSLDCIYIEDLYCFNELKNKDRYLQRSMGTLGGGNHFIEVDEAKDGSLIFIVHSGSRNLGKQVCEIYQNKAIEHCSFKEELKVKKQELIKHLKLSGQQNKIQDELKKLDEKYLGKTKLPKDLCYIEGKEREQYLHDMKLCQKWAKENREWILSQLLVGLNVYDSEKVKHTIHNYIAEDNIVRKGAISAELGELVLIPINMRDGCIIGCGKGNEDWNKSAPHGAGRIMSRNEAKAKLDLEQYKAEMKDVFSTSVGIETIDEAPMAYKPIQEILDNIKDTVAVLEIVKPIYNFKAKE